MMPTHIFGAKHNVLLQVCFHRVLLKAREQLQQAESGSADDVTWFSKASVPPALAVAIALNHGDCGS